MRVEDEGGGGYGWMNGGEGLNFCSSSESGREYMVPGVNQVRQSDLET